MDVLELLKNAQQICYYPSSGIDLSDIDYFASDKLPYFIRKQIQNKNNIEFNLTNLEEKNLPPKMPDLFIHTDLNFYKEFEDGFSTDDNDCLLYGINKLTHIKHQEISPLNINNEIYPTSNHAGRCFLYNINAWDKQIKLIVCIIENEAFVSKVLLENSIKTPIIWTKDWNGSKTYGTWLANVFKDLNTAFFYSDWLSVPKKNMFVNNSIVYEKYPNLQPKESIKLVKNADLCFIDEGKHGWVEEYIVVK